ncbi:MAG: HAD family phosphatase [Leptospiraceae bacterium]|nr:HAD family phosphatase [Leptospiraceae bacterium]MCP5495015.1 HAD family phosphatase [Leptospiraceae bacterium]
MVIKDIKGIIFDMDGTLVDSEINTEKSVSWLLSKYSIPAINLDLKQFHGITWESITQILQNMFPDLNKYDIKPILQNKFHEMFMSKDLPYIPGALEFFRKSTSKFPTAIATSSDRESVYYLIERMDVKDKISLFLSAEDYSKSKPDPECYLLTAQKLGISPENCLVFEDSIPGLQAAKAAGMWAIAITKNATDLNKVKQHSDMCVQDYRELSINFCDLIK